MLKHILLTSIILLAAVISSCNKQTPKPVVAVPTVKLIPVKMGDNFGYIDRQGRTVIEPQFAEACIFRNGLALVNTAEQAIPSYGFISEDGKMAIPSQYKDATVFTEGLAWVVSKNSAPSAINTKGEIKFTMKECSSVKIFKEGLAAFSVGNYQDEKWGFVDKEGKIKITPQFSAAGNFNSGKCGVKNNKEKWGYINKDGKVVINYQFDVAFNFVKDRAIVISGGKSGVINESGKYIINPQFQDMYNDHDMFIIVQDNKWGWCDKYGNILIAPQFEEAYPFLDNEITAVKTDKGFGYINKEGKMVVNPQFNFASSFNGNLGLVTNDSDKVGFIGKDGKYIINPQFDDDSYDYILFLSYGASTHESIESDLNRK